MCIGELLFLPHMTCIERTTQKMNGRFFAGRRIEAELFSGKQHFKRGGIADDIEGDGEEAEKQRLDDFASWLMAEGD